MCRFYLALVVSLFTAANLYAYRISGVPDTVRIRFTRGDTTTNSFYVNDGRFDTAKAIKQGWDTIHVSITGSPEWHLASNAVSAFLTSAEIRYSYSPTTLAPSTAKITIVGDSNTLTVILIGTVDTNSRCVSIPLSYGLEVPEGGTVSGFDTIYNLTDSSIIADSIWIEEGGASNFGLTLPSLPLVITAHSSLHFGITFHAPTPAPSFAYGGRVNVLVRGNSPDGIPCRIGTGNVEWGIKIPWDTLALYLPPSGTDTLVLNARAAITGHAIIIHNNTSARLLVRDIRVADTGEGAHFIDDRGPHCKYGGIDNHTYCLNDTLVPDATSDTIPLLLTQTDSGTYTVNLAVDFANALTAQRYVFVSHYSFPSKSGVLSLGKTQSFSIYPNPAHTSITISLPTDLESSIEITDVLGSVLLSQKASGEIAWQPKGSGGVYFVRVAGRGMDGSLSVSTKRIVFER